MTDRHGNIPEGVSPEALKVIDGVSAQKRKGLEGMSARQYEMLASMIFLMERCEPVRGADLVGRFGDPTSASSEDAWDLIERAERAGIIERTKMVLPATRFRQRWRLVGGSHPEVTESYI